MNKWLSVLLVLSLAGCGGGGSSSNTEQQVPDSTPPVSSTPTTPSPSSPPPYVENPYVDYANPLLSNWQKPTSGLPTSLGLPFAIEDIDFAHGGVNPMGVFRFDQDQLAHPGIDILLYNDSQVTALTDGKILRMDQDAWDGAYEIYIQVEDSDWQYTIHPVWPADGIQVGDSVTKGQALGRFYGGYRQNPGTIHVDVRYFQSSNGEIQAQEPLCWPDFLSDSDRQAFYQKYHQFNTHADFVSSWHSLNNDGVYPFRNLLSQQYSPDGPQLCYPFGTDVREQFKAPPGNDHSQPWGDSYSQTITIDQDTTYTDTALVYENTRIVFDGTLILDGNSSLTCSNCQFYFDQDHSQEHFLIVRDNASLDLNRVYVESKNYRMLNWQFEDNASISLVDMRANTLWTSAHLNIDYYSLRSPVGLTLDNDPAITRNIRIVDSPEVHLELTLVEPGDITVNLPRSFEWIEHYDSPFVDSLVIDNSFVHYLDVDVTPGVHATIENAVNFQFGWPMWNNYQLAPETPVIDGLASRLFKDQLFSNGVSSIRLVNTYFKSFWPTTFDNFELVVKNSTMADPRSHEDSILWIENSTMGPFSAGDNSRFFIKDSQLSTEARTSENAYMEITNSTFSDDFNAVQLDNSTLVINN